MKKNRFHVILIKPSKYADDGYVIRWWRAVVTSNSLACLVSLTEDVRKRKLLGEDVELVTHIYDETVQRIPVQKLCRKIMRAGERGIVSLAGVQSNQFPRALDLAAQFKRGGLPVMIGGFHVSGITAMLPEKIGELTEAAKGITLVAGEVEEHWHEILKDAYENRFKGFYNFLAAKPELRGVPGPLMNRANLKYFINTHSSFDAGRGCPFRCSFCTIINVQGNTMRPRSADDIERLIRENHKQGITHFFITDDNFARNKEWEAIADRLIRLKEKEGFRCSLMLQTDTMAHKIPGFIEKMTRAGCRRVFIGMESVNPENLDACGKRQNKLDEYRRMLQAWRNHGALTCAGYIIGFPGDTHETVMRDIEFLKREIPLDLAEFFILTPLPGSEDHQKMTRAGVPMDRDLNRYDADHVVMNHPRMSRTEWERTYQDAWKSFYSREHCLTLLKRRYGPRQRLVFSSLVWFRSAFFLTGVHPLLSGYFRIKNRKDRRPGMPLEPIPVYYTKCLVEFFKYSLGMIGMIWKLWRLVREARKPEYADYQDVAIRPETNSPLSSKQAA
ncbi:MAG: biotin synthase [Candidatus Omnitrophica bacterium ADurb.Bin277]|nr:MAG: biotin synthase [Candidatus Omnitrophica bacterium ADurb.Bin277]